MSKRFRDTGLWDKEWYVELSCAERCALDYILCRCDPVGVWAPAFALADRMIGDKIDWNELLRKVNGNLEVLPDGKWWLVDFCRYQHGDLFSHKESGAIKCYMALLAKHGLLERVRKQFDTVGDTVPDRVGTTLQGKGIGKGKGEGRGEGEEKETYAEDVRMTKAEHSALVGQYGEKVIALAIEKVAAQQIKTGKKYKSPRGAVLQWGIRAALEELKKQPMDRSPPPKPKCTVCGKVLERDKGAWNCKEHGRQE